MRKQQTIKFPLSKASQTKVRADYKKNNGLARNCTLESVYRSLGVFNEKQASNVLTDLYNIRIEKENAKIDKLRVLQRVQVRTQKRKTDKANKPQTFIITSQMVVTYLQPWYENNVA